MKKIIICVAIAIAFTTAAYGIGSMKMRNAELESKWYNRAGQWCENAVEKAVDTVGFWN